MEKYDHTIIESKWQKEWAAAHQHEAADKVPGRDNYLLLTEFPYPSGNLHIGHWYAFSLPDIRARYLRMKGYNVLYPIGFDAFGLPAENAAIKHNVNPRQWTEDNIEYMSGQLRSMGATFDWSRVVSTIDPEYYRWTQWIFLKMYEKGLAYRAKTTVNWCPNDKTVLANEQVVAGLCERCDTPVVQKEVTQWLFKITQYAESLLRGLDELDWPETTKQAQRHWIGKKEGISITYPVDGTSETVTCFTTRPDTNFGATFIVLAPEHPFVKKIISHHITPSDSTVQVKDIEVYVTQAGRKTQLERQAEGHSKTGVFTGFYAVNQLNSSKLPIWVSDFVLGNFGTGAVVGVPGHDQRDFAFATTFNLPVVRVVVGPDGDASAIAQLQQVQEEAGTMINSDFLDGLDIHVATQKVTEYLEKQGWGERTVTYKLHDWVLSRQRYWGVPIPMIYCANCAAQDSSDGYHPVNADHLPVILPELKDFKPADDGRSPLAKAEDWAQVPCPKCGTLAQRETDTMDTFVDSSWYFLRYTDPHNDTALADQDKIEAWLPAPMYIGGSEHNTMHLLYSRFFTHVLHDLGLISFAEPYLSRVNRGFVLGPNGLKMSKSRGNVIDPDIEVARYGADTVRLYLAFMGPYEQGGPWDPNGITGAHRFINRIWRLVQSHLEKGQSAKIVTSHEQALHLTIKKVGEDIDGLQFNTAVSELMKLLNVLEDATKPEDATLPRETIIVVLQLLAPLAPHITEELWHEALGEITSIHETVWPSYDEAKLTTSTQQIVVQVNGKVRGTLSVSVEANQEQIEAAARALPNVAKYVSEEKTARVIYIAGRLVNFVIT